MVCPKNKKILYICIINLVTTRVFKQVLGQRIPSVYAIMVSRSFAPEHRHQQWLALVCHQIRTYHQGPLLLKWFNFNLSMDKLLHAQESGG